VFFVTCGKGANVFNAFFSKSEVEKGSVLAAAKHVEKSHAIELCEQFARSRTNHPSTVKFSRVLDMTVTEHSNGRTSVQSSFKAKNSLNLELKYNVRCLMDAAGLFEGNISEAGR
jgi:hypothetical protein